MTEARSVDSCASYEEGGTWRLLCARLRRDERGRPESVTFAYVVKSEGYPDGAPRREVCRTEPFLRGWQGAMAHWASRNLRTR